MSPALLSQGPESSRPPEPDPFPRHPGVGRAAEESDLGEWLANFWDGRYLILGCVALALAMGVFAAWTSVPVYRIQAMLQIQAKKEKVTDPAFAKMENLFSEPTDALAEIELLKSNLVLGRTVEALHLDIVATPKFAPLVGRALHRNDPDPPAIAIQAFEVPAALLGTRFRLTCLGDGGYRWTTLKGGLLAEGRPGGTVRATYLGQAMRLSVSSLAGRPGQRFEIVHLPMQVAIANISANFDATEKGKGTGVIGLTYKSPSQVVGTATLAQILNEYLRHKAEKKGGDAGQTLAILQAKMPVLKAKLDESETRLNQFRSQSGSVDLNREADSLVTQNAALNSQISSLKQKREELLRTYKENADVVVTVNDQIAKLQSEVKQTEVKIRVLPGTEQTVARLSRDVAVNQELYTALLNNIQELQLTRSGDVGSFELVDPATPDMQPLGVQPGMQAALFGFLGLLAGAGLARLRRMLRSGVKDHRLIESKLGIPVVVTIPHSGAQDRHSRAILKHQEGLHLLTEQEPDDLATEALRSLRTVLHFSMHDTGNRVIVLTGPAPGIGKSFVSSNFAVLLAQSGAGVLLVDGDLRRGNLHRFFGLKTRHPGFADVLSRGTDWQDAVRKTEIPGLDLLTTGLLPPKPSELLMSDRFPAFVAAVSAVYQYVIIDAPPLLAVTDAAVLGAKAGAVLLVARFGQHPLDELRACQRRLDTAGVRLLGCVFNDVRESGLGYLGRNYTYDYHYTYKKQT